MAIKPLEILIKAKDQASGVFDGLKGKVAGLGAAIAGYFGVRFFQGVIEDAAGLEAKLSEVGAVSNATAEEMQQLRKAAEDAGTTTKFTASEAAEALAELARSGMSAKESMATLPAVLQLAQAGKVGLAQASEYVTSTIAAFVLKAEDAGRVADVLAKGADSSKTSVTGLAQALSYAAPVAKGLGLSMEYTVALIGKFADAGIDASRAGTALNAILSQFSDPASKFRQELAALGITTGNFEEALRDLAKAGPASRAAILAVGTEAGPALRGLLNKGIGALDDLHKTLRNAGGAAAETAKKIEDNLLGSLSGLGSAWDAVKIALGTPVLPVLRDGVERLSKVLQEAVANGTVKKFGDALAQGFQAGLTWAREFFASVDPTAVVTRLRSFADEAAETFRRAGEAARNAGNLVQLAYGLMSAGANAVLTAVYGVGAAFARVAQDVMRGVALLREGVASITFGELSASIKLAAQDARETAGAFGAAAEAMENKAVASFNGMAEGATTARAAWAGLTDQADETAGAMRNASRAIDATAQDLVRLGDTSDAQSRRMRYDNTQQAQALAATREAVQALRRDYEQAVATGNWQLATAKMGELRKATEAAGSAAGDLKRKHEEAAKAIDDAFMRMGISTKATLATAAETARKDFELIKSSGQATAEGLRTAWTKYAEAAIAANGGVASATLKAQASMQGLEITTDATGKSIVRAMGAGTQAVGNLESSLQLTNEQLQAQAEAWDRILMRYKLAADYSESQIALLEKDIALRERREELERKRLNVDKNGFSLDKAGNTLVAGGDLTSLTGIAAFLKNAGVADDAKARAIAREFADAQGNIPYFNNPGQLRYGGANSTMSQALLKAAERYTFGVGNIGAGMQPASIPKQERVITLRLQGANGVTREGTMPEAAAEMVIATLKDHQLAAGR